MDINNIHKSKMVSGIIIGILAVIIILVVFQAGVMAGYHRARFNGNFGDNFSRNFIGPRGGMFGMGLGGNLPIGGHGAVGKIVSMALPEIVVAGPDQLEKIIIVDETTLVRQFRDEIKVNNLKIGDYIVVIGNPNNEGKIEAKLIRNVPPPPEFATSTANRINQ